MAKSAAGNTPTTGPEAAATTRDRSVESLSVGRANLDERDIARRAYELYLARGRQDGHDVEDWLRAESELHVDSQC
jgi:hypothetical protein